MARRSRRGKRVAPRPRNPFALYARRRRAVAEPSERKYRRRTKHPAKPETPEEDS